MSDLYRFSDSLVRMLGRFGIDNTLRKSATDRCNEAIISIEDTVSRIPITIGSEVAEPLIEVHDEAEVEAALAAGARVIGVNNRDLRTFAEDLGTTERLARLVPAGATLVVNDNAVLVHLNQFLQQALQVD